MSILHYAVFYNIFIMIEEMKQRRIKIEVMRLYRRIRDLREDHDLTQKQVAKKLNCSQQVYSNYELGQRDIPTDLLIKLSKMYNVSTDYILGITDNPTINR